jgi:subtilisin family serine protease
MIAFNTSSAFFVCAAGHGDTDNDVTPYYPSSYESPNIIAVTATDQFDNLITEANYGAISVDVGAPGENILSCFPGNEYRFGGGTSMACSYVSGLAALLQAQYPFLTNERLKIIIEANVDPIGSLNGLVATGGRVNAFKALRSNPAPPAPPAPVVAGGGGGGGG